VQSVSFPASLDGKRSTKPAGHLITQSTEPCCNTVAGLVLSERMGNVNGDCSRHGRKLDFVMGKSNDALSEDSESYRNLAIGPDLKKA